MDLVAVDSSGISRVSGFQQAADENVIARSRDIIEDTIPAVDVQPMQTTAVTSWLLSFIFVYTEIILV